MTREIILGGARFSAVDAFAAFYEMAELRALCERAFGAIDALALPTMPKPTPSTKCRPIRSTSTAGSAPTRISSICSISALCGAGGDFAGRRAVRSDAHRARRDDARIASIARRFHADTALPLGATRQAQPPLGH